MESLTREGLLLAFKDAGSGAPPILLIHDLGSDHRSLRGQFTHFRRRHRVVAVDLRGHGKSDGHPTEHTAAGFAEDLYWLCCELGLYRPVAVGQGLGGLYALELAVRHPELLSAVVAMDAPLLSGALTRDDRAEASGMPLYPTTSWGLAEEWDRATTLALCRAPILLVETRLHLIDVDRIHWLPSGVSVKAVQGNRQREATKQINGLIDAFVAETEVGPCLRHRGSVD